MWVLLAVLLAVGGSLAPVIHARYVQWVVVRAVRAAGGTAYHWRLQAGGLPAPPDQREPLRPFGHFVAEYFRPVMSVAFPSATGTGPDEALIEQISRLDSIEEIDFQPINPDLLTFPYHTSIKDKALCLLAATSSVGAS